METMVVMEEEVMAAPTVELAAVAAAGWRVVSSAPLDHLFADALHHLRHQLHLHGRGGSRGEGRDVKVVVLAAAEADLAKAGLARRGGGVGAEGRLHGGRHADGLEVALQLLHMREELVHVRRLLGAHL